MTCPHCGSRNTTSIYQPTIFEYDYVCRDCSKGFDKDEGGLKMPKYENGQLTERIENNFKYHKPKDDQPERYERIRAKAKELAYVIAEDTPSSREQSVALTELESVVMWANAAIARNE